MELIKVQRYSFAKDWTLSRYFVQGQLTGFGVEDEIRAVKVHGETAVPFGTYSLGYRQSPKFSSSFYYNDDFNKLIEKKDYLKLANKSGWRAHDLIWVKDIPNFMYVLLHWGNTDDDTDGCYIVGNKVGIIKGQEGVLESRNNYMKMYPKVYPLVKKGNYTITYTR